MSCMMIMSVFTFTGCNLLHDNNKRVNAEVVAKVGDEVITRNDLTTWFNYYYYSSGLYYQYTEEEVYELTLNNLVKFKLIINEAKHTEDIVLSVSDQNHIWEQVFDYVDQTLDSYESDIKERYGIEETEKEEEEKEETKPTIFEKYERAEVTYSIDYDQNDTVLNNTYEIPTIDGNYYRYLAYQKYLKEITESANRYSKKKISSEQAWAEEINRYYKYYEDRLYVQKYNDYCLKNIVITDDAIVSAYVNDLNAQIQKFGVYDNFIGTLTNSSNTDLVLYYEQGNTFAVQQIVLGFDDMISTTHNSSSINVSEFLSKYLNSGFVFDEKDAKTDEQKEYISIREDYALNNSESLDMTYIDPDTGLTTDEDGNEIVKTYDDFKIELKAIEDAYKNKLLEIGGYDPVTEADKIKSETAKAERDFVQAFYKLKFSYSKDGGVTDLTSLFNKVGYTFPQDEEDMTASWVSEFSKAAYELYDEYTNSGEFGIKTFVSNYGVHVMIFAGTMNYGPIAEKNIESLESTYFCLSTDQTVADYYHDKLLNKMQSADSSNYYLQAMLGSNISTTVYEKVSSILYNEYKVAGKIDIKYPEYDDIM